MRAPKWWRRLTLRGRLMLIGAGGLAAGFAIGGVALVALLTLTLQRSSESQGRQTAHEVVTLLNDGALSQPIPVAGLQFVQVVDSSQRVRAASATADALVPILRPSEIALASEGKRLTVPGERAGLDGPLQVVSLPAGESGDPLSVIVAVPMGQAVQSINVLRNTLLVTYPLLVAGISLLAWKVVGATLQPVEDLRSGAERIAHSGRSQRLAVPDGHDEIHRLAVTLNEMLARQEAAQQRQRAFVADAAHELRSPLANLRVELEVAQHHGQPLSAEDLLIDVHRLGRLVDDLLLLARADAEQPALDTEEVDLGQLLREVADGYRAARVPVLVAPALHGPQQVTGDTEALRRVLANLVDNAVRHAQSRVSMALTKEGQDVIVTVTDDGPGIAEEDGERVFGRFTRLDDARARDAGGSGLGLAIVRELVGKHHGTVHLEDARPGVRAVIRLPRAEDGAHN